MYIRSDLLPVLYVRAHSFDSPTGNEIKSLLVYEQFSHDLSISFLFLQPCGVKFNAYILSFLTRFSHKGHALRIHSLFLTY